MIGWNQDLEELEISILEHTKTEIPKFIKFCVKYLVIPICGILFVLSFISLVLNILMASFNIIEFLDWKNF